MDWDNDGKIDLLAGDSSGKVVFFRNTGTSILHRYLNRTIGSRLSMQGDYAIFWRELNGIAEKIPQNL